MNLYFAPLEGITTYVFRNAHNEFFPGCDIYCAPFISPTENEKVSRKLLRDILPENNTVKKLSVQVITAREADIRTFAQKITLLGYDEININLGCPFPTVVNKGRGSGMLRDTDALDRFLSDVFENTDIPVSVKTRAGFESTEEIKKLISIYNKYPISLLTIHPRSKVQMYTGCADKEAFLYAYENAKMPICYNGDVFSVKDYEDIAEKFGGISSVMIGRGAIKNPALFRQIRGGKPICTRELIDFSRLLSARYMEVLDSDRFTLNKLKEVWMYMMWNFPNEKKIAKAIKKSMRLSELFSAIELLGEIENQK